MSAVTGRALAPAPTLTPAERKLFGARSARRFETVTFKPAGETKDISFPFLNVGENRKLSVLITGFFLVEAAPGKGFTGEETGAFFKFTWPKGVTGVNPRSIGIFVKPPHNVIGARFGEPLNLCLPTATEDTLKVEYKREEGGATFTALDLFLRVDEEWELAEAPTLKPTLGAHAVGVARPKMKVVGANGGTATLPPLEERGTAS